LILVLGRNVGGTDWRSNIQLRRPLATMPFGESRNKEAT
jgi:hypothetical protein